ncbi:MAG: ABC-type transport auxiliary lipoprotein family protein [Pseudomonadota bacterium]
MRLALLPSLFLGLLMACTETTDPLRYTTGTPQPSARVSIPLTSVSVREVSLPAYAAEEGIAVADASGAITAGPDNIWADEPTRAVTLRLTNTLADLTGRLVASDPWPFQDPPEAVVEVRIEEFVAEASGSFVASGRYYVSHGEDVERTDRARAFRLVQPYNPEAGFAAIAEARTRIVSALAVDIARRGLK